MTGKPAPAVPTSVRGLDGDLRRRATVRARVRGVTVGQVLNEALAAYFAANPEVAA